jgi:hypothetical protein
MVMLAVLRFWSDLDWTRQGLPVDEPIHPSRFRPRVLPAESAGRWRFAERTEVSRRQERMCIRMADSARANEALVRSLGWKPLPQGHRPHRLCVAADETLGT